MISTLKLRSKPWLWCFQAGCTINSATNPQNLGNVNRRMREGEWLARAVVPPSNIYFRSWRILRFLGSFVIIKLLVED